MRAAHGSMVEHLHLNGHSASYNAGLSSHSSMHSSMYSSRHASVLPFKVPSLQHPPHTQRAPAPASGAQAPRSTRACCTSCSCPARHSRRDWGRSQPTRSCRSRECPGCYSTCCNSCVLRHEAMKSRVSGSSEACQGVPRRVREFPGVSGSFGACQGGGMGSGVFRTRGVWRVWRGVAWRGMRSSECCGNVRAGCVRAARGGLERLRAARAIP